MKQITYIITFAFFTLMISPKSIAQIGINNNAPKGIIDVKASNPSAPAFNDGVLVPRVDDFPSIDPGADQDGMMFFLNNSNLANFKKRHHYWDNTQAKRIPFGGQWLDGYNQSSEKLTYVKQAYGEKGVDVVILDNGRMGLGTDDPDESIEVKFPGDNDIQITSANVPNAPNFHFVTYNGTFAARQFLNDDDPIGSVAVSAWSGSGESGILASITSLADGNHSSGNLPSKYNFSTTGVGNDSEDDNGIEMTIEASGNVGIGNEDPTAGLHIKAGGTSPLSAPIKFSAGTNLTTTEKGAFEYDGTHLYFTKNVDRKILLKGLTSKPNINFLPILPGTALEATVTVTNAKVGSSCNCNPVGAIEAGLNWSCYVMIPNTIRIRLANGTAGAIDPAARDWKVTVIE
jgi:hypothetical protein